MKEGQTWSDIQCQEINWLSCSCLGTKNGEEVERRLSHNLSDKRLQGQCRIEEADRVHIQSKASVNGDAET